MARGRRFKQEVINTEAALPTPQSSQQSNHQHSIMTTEVPLRAGSQPISLTSRTTPTMAADSTSSTRADATEGDTEMTEAPGREAMQALADQSRELIQVIQKLEALKIKSTLPSLPMFVVIGDQSAGKSSIIEAACDVTLPRDEGTCTRCPFKITTSASRNGEPWQCTITLHREFAWTPGTMKASTGATFDNWSNQQLDVLDFVTVYSKSDLELALRRAQMAILNPDRDHEAFIHAAVDASMVKNQTIGFSPNVISLEIMAPELPELSFYDLPGAINTLGDESQQYLVDFVEALLKSYLNKEKAYILLACAANQDMETSTAFRFLRQSKATHRSMGILTKSDLVDFSSARITGIRDQLLGDSYRVGDGWFVTRQLSQKEINRNGYTHAQARELEAKFFTGAPWSSELADFANRFGILNLSANISQKLTEHIFRELPQIIQRVQTALDKVDKKLASFPEQAVAPALTVLTEIGRLEGAIDAEINADSHRSTFRDPYRQVFRNFAEKLKGLKPIVRVNTPGFQKPSISLDSSDEEESPTKSQRMSGGSASRFMSQTPSSKSVQKRVRRAPATSSSDGDNAGKLVFHLDTIRAKFDSAPGADIPGQASEAVVRELTLKTMEGWGGVVHGVVKRIKAILLRTLDVTTTETLSQYRNTEFLRRVKKALFDLLEDLMKDVTNVVSALVAAETHRPITYNTEQIKQKRSTFEVELQKRRLECRLDEYNSTVEAQTGKVPSKVDQKNAEGKLGDDEYDREVKALATPMAYYTIASAQLVDVVAKQFEHGLMGAYSNRLQRKLYEDLRAYDQDHCAQLLAEDPETERERIEFTAERGRLQQALAELNGLPNLRA